MVTRDTHRAGEEIAKLPSAQVGKELQSAKVTLSGTPMAVTFAGMGLEDADNVDYVVSIQGEFAGAVSVDESTITTAGFSIIGGAATEVAHIMIHGETASRTV